MSTEQWVQLVIAIFGAGGTGAMATQLLTRSIESGRKRRVERAIIDAAKITDSLQAFQSAIGAGRVLLSYGSNGGGIPSAGKNIHVTIVHELKNKELKPIKPLFQQMVTDSGYVKMLAEVIEKGIVVYTDIEGQLPDGFLKDLYMQEEVHTAYIRHIKTIPHDRFYFISARWYGEEHAPMLGELNLAFQILNNQIEPLL